MMNQITDFKRNVIVYWCSIIIVRKFSLLIFFISKYSIWNSNWDTSWNKISKIEISIHCYKRNWVHSRLENEIKLLKGADQVELYNKSLKHVFIFSLLNKSSQNTRCINILFFKVKCSVKFLLKEILQGIRKEKEQNKCVTLG